MIQKHIVINLISDNRTRMINTLRDNEKQIQYLITDTDRLKVEIKNMTALIEKIDSLDEK